MAASHIAAELPPVHPGEILLEEFLKPYRLSAYKAAQRMHVPRTRIERLVEGKTPVTVDTAVRLGRFFRTTPAFWLNLQTRFDLLSNPIPDELEEIEPVGADFSAAEPEVAAEAAPIPRPAPKAATSRKTRAGAARKPKGYTVDGKPIY